MTTATQHERKALLPAVHLKSGGSQHRGLARDLKKRVRGDVRFDGGGRALYATDLSAYRQVPIGVVVPRDVEDVLKTVETCRRFEAPILCRGGGTSLGGQTCNVAVVIDFSRYMRGITALDPDRKQARVEPGVVCDQLRDAAEEYHLTWGPDPATHRYCTLGGMIANNSCGTHSIVAGRSSDNVERLKVLTYDGHVLDVGPTSDEDLVRIIDEGGRKGEIYSGLRAVRDRYGELVRQRYPRIPRRVSGFNIDDLLPENGFNVARALAGTEGTCAITLEATTRLIDSPPARVLLVLGYPDQYQAADHVWELRSYGPRTIECVDTSQIINMRRLNLHQSAVKLLPEGGAWLLLTYGGANGEEARDRAHTAMQQIERNCRPASMHLYEDPVEQQQVWLVRESAIGASRIPSEFETWSSWEDAAVHPEKMGPYLRDFKKLLDQFGYACVFFGHYGDGCVHSRINFDFKTAAGVKKFRAWMEAASDLVLAYGGSLSGEHGDGQSHAELHPKMFGDELVQGFREFKLIWDPERKMNPNKVVDPYPFDSNLRFGPSYNPKQPKTVFRFPDDKGSFANATARCFGVGLCRKAAGGTMCPSYMVTRDEMHTTRGRTHLLFEMLQGEAITKGWRDKHVKESLDLCLACKGCKGECPVKVDVATYKAEFLSHYYAGRLRPAAAYATGLIMWWARLAGVAPGLANMLTHVRPLEQLGKAAIGLAPEREVPRFASTTFKRWFRQRGPRNPGGSSVLLWPDTFNNHFHPETAIAAVELLETAGFRVQVPAQALCCGRPLYDHGMLTLARRMLRDVLEALGPQIRAGVPLVALEPSCAAVFRDELINLFPNDQDARRLAQQTLSLAEFLQRHAPEFEWPQLAGKRALLHGHCHQKAVWGTSADAGLLRRLGLELVMPDAGCCGLAGSFGYEKGEKYDVSVKAGERVLAPAIREAGEDTLIVGDGFSCRSQIAHLTHRRAMHLAEVLHMALRQDQLPDEHRPEDAYLRSLEPPAGRRPAGVGAALLGLSLVAGGVVAAGLVRSRRHASA